MCAYKGVSRLDLAIDSRLASRQSGKHVKHAGNWRVTTVRALQDKMYSLAKQLALDLNSQLIPLARQNSQKVLFGWKLNFLIPHTLYYKYPYTHEMLRASRENFERETLEKNKIDSFTIFILWFSKFLYSHLCHWYILERYISQILISPYLYQWEDILVLRK